MQKNKLISTTVASFIVTIAGLMGPQAQATATADYWECTNRLGGEWNFGRAPSICNVNHRMDPALVAKEYSPLLFTDTKDRTGERNRYMTEMYSFIRESGTYYLKKRNPQVSAAELNGFIAGFLTLAHGESYWSHYRIVGDGITRYMRGDVGHGHGMMQVDDRSHYAALVDGKGVSLVENVIYGLDVYYAAWVRTPTATCITSATDYKSRARAAWSAYNGGPSKLCRWTNANDAHAAKDKAYLTNYDSKLWMKYVASTTAPVSVDIPCLAEGKTSCGKPSTPPSEQPPAAGKLYQSTASQYCIFKNAGFECVNEFRDVACVEALEGRDLGTAEKLTASVEKAHPFKTYDRNTLCSQSIKGLVKIGGKVQIQKNINIRATPAGQLSGSLALGSTYTVIDFEVRDHAKQDRYYKVKTDSADGYFYAGAATDFASWATETTVVAEPTPGLAQAGQNVEVLNAGGINLRKDPGGTLLTNIPKAAVLAVRSVVVKGNVSSVYYEVLYNGSIGFIYTGDLSPKSTIANWTRVTTAPVVAPPVRPAPTPVPVKPAPTPAPTPVRPAPTPVPPPVVSNPTVKGLVTVKRELSYRYLRSCASSFCAPTSTVARAPSATSQGDLLLVLEQSGDAVKVRVLSKGVDGWLKASDVTGFVP